MRKLLPLTLCLLSACLSQPAPEAKVDAKADTGAKIDGEAEAGEPTPSNPDASLLGSKRSETCKTLMTEFAALRASEPAVALADFALGYRDPNSTTAAWVQSTDKAVARVDDSGQPIDHLALLAALDQSVGAEPTVTERARIDVVQLLNRVAMIDVRRKFERVAKAGEPEGMPLDDLEPLVAEWDDAWCLWDGTLRPLAHATDEEGGGEAWEEQIVEAFNAGRTGLIGKYDQTRVRTNREIAEKSTYAAVQRLLLVRARSAKEANDARVARVAYGLLGVIEDRILDRNGPGLLRVQAMLKGSPAEIDPDMIERELDKAFVKRARKYCDEAVVSNELGTGEGIKGTWEGLVYSKLILPGMRETLAGQGFDADAYMADWDSYVVAVEGSDASGAAAISERLVQWNCAYQEALGIAECSTSSNELQ